MAVGDTTGTGTIRLGWLGLGSMGNAMAQNLQKAINRDNEASSSSVGRQPLRFYNRTASRGRLLQDLGATQCNSASQVVDESDMIFISLSDDSAVKGIVQEILSGGQLSSKVVVDTTTVHPDTTKYVANLLNDAGAQFVAAPMFGSSVVAQSGSLLAAVAGPPSAVRVLGPLLKDVVAREVLVVSEAPEKAVLLKTIGNFLIAGLMQITAESHVFAEKAGLDPMILESLIERNFGALAYSDSQRMTGGIYCPARDQPPYSDLNLALKDVGHGISSAAEVGVKLAVGEIIMDNLKEAKKYSDDHDERALDSSSLYGVLREKAGLDFRTDSVKRRDGEL